MISPEPLSVVQFSAILEESVPTLQTLWEKVQEKVRCTSSSQRSCILVEPFATESHELWSQICHSSPSWHLLDFSSDAGFLTGEINILQTIVRLLLGEVKFSLEKSFKFGSRFDPANGSESLTKTKEGKRTWKIDLDCSSENF